MNFVNGKIITSEECELVLENIDGMIMKTLKKPPLDINVVINVCDKLSKIIDGLDVVKRLPELGLSPHLAEMYINQIRQMLSAKSIEKRLKTELGEVFYKPQELIYLHSKAKAVQTIVPLGVLFHITAGNVDGLPFMSLLEGLLTGNINIVKLPTEEGGITVSLLDELFKLEPSLSEYVYVFDYSSKDVYAIKRLAEVADAIVVWGGDEAVNGARALANPNTRIIEWGHKISFAYVTTSGINKDALYKLALNICLTNQLFCSSCQGVFLDTDNMEDIYNFCEEFLPVLEQVSEENPFAFDDAAKLFIQAKITLEIYHQQIEKCQSSDRIFKGKGCSITACSDNRLQASSMYRNLWVKPLKKDEILNLRLYKNYLQTAALICANSEYDELASQLLKAGIIKISDGFEMSNYAFGEAHDGEFTLRSYTKLVSVQNCI